ncbi:hypothetical protein RS030_71027 [Cryptosporidium xiaoi]|uniref:LITAF domain-containing protein n=1 Tax=Cryptosporidium xiaoi TaxID=659607 RepID=A0AAV9XUC4_9CRYT
MGLFLPESPEQYEKRKNDISDNTCEFTSPPRSEVDFLLKLQNTEDKIINAEPQYFKFKSNNLDENLSVTPVRNTGPKYGLKRTRIRNETHLTPKIYFNEDVINTVPKTVGIFTHSVRKQYNDDSENIHTKVEYSKGSQKQNIQTKVRSKIYCNKCKHLIKEKSMMNKTRGMLSSLFVFFCDFLLCQLPSTLILYSLALFLLPNTTKG